MNGIIYITHDKGRDFKYQRKGGILNYKYADFLKYF